MKIGAGFFAAIVSSPIAAATGLVFLATFHFQADFAFEISNNAHIRTLGHQAADPTAWSFFGQQVLRVMSVLPIAIIFVILANILLGLPTLLVVEHLVRSILVRMALLLAAGIVAGGCIWPSLVAPALPIDLTRFTEGAAFGAAGALFLSLIYYRLAKERPVG